MTIDEAIERLRKIMDGKANPYSVDSRTALNMGDEALKFYQRLEIAAGEDFNRPLPGETPEIDSKRSLHHIKQILESNEVRK